MRLAFAVLVLVLWPSVAFADPHPMSSGAVPAPTTDTQVAMTKELLTITLDPRTAQVAAAVTLENHGPATTLTVGFPCASGDDAGQIDVPCTVPLGVRARGKRLRTTAQRTGKRQTHWVWPMQLAADETVDLVVTYRAPLLNDRYRIPAHGMGLFTYRLTTGARWAGPIGKLRITVQHMQEPLLFISPAGYQREPGRITWALDDHEPTEEVVLMPHPIAAARLAQAIGGKTAAAYRRRLEAGDYRKADLDAAIRLLKDASGEWRDGWPTTISPLGGVPVPSKARIDAVIAESLQLLEQLAARAKR